jgi:hypothetical protein
MPDAPAHGGYPDSRHELTNPTGADVALAHRLERIERRIDGLEHTEARVHALIAERIADLELIAAAAIVDPDEGTNPVLEAAQNAAAVAAATRRLYERVMGGGPDAGERRRDQAEDR